MTAKNQDDRALQGNLEYTANLIFGYDNIGAGHQLTVLLNQNGQAIADVVYRGSRMCSSSHVSISTSYRYEFSDSLTIRAKLENLLDDEVEYSQGGQVFQIYNRGPTIQVGLDWQL